MSADQIRADLVARWRDDGILRLCLQLVAYVEYLGADQSQLLTFKALAGAVGKDRLDDDLMRALAILVGSRVAALDARGLLIDEDEQEYELTAAELAEARASGELIHPETGQPVPEFEARLVPFFVPSARFRADGA